MDQAASAPASPLSSAGLDGGSVTPDVPDHPQAPAPGGAATVVKPVPAPGSEVTAESSAPPPPPVVHTDPRARAAFERSLQASSGNDLSTAERELKAALQLDPKLDYAWTNLGVLYERQALATQAESAYQKALELNPDQALAWDYLARLYCRTNRAVKIEAILRGKIAERPAAMGIRIALVVTLLAQNKLESAATEAKKILKADERNVRAMQLLGQVYYKESKFELAKMVTENARAIDPSDAGTYNALGLVSLALKQRPAAMEDFARAAQLKPDYAEALNNYGAMLNETQDYDGAVKALEAAVNAAPDFAAARMNLANAYRGQQQFQKALSQYQQVMKLAPALADTYYNVAVLHLDSDLPNMDPIERYKTAISFFEQYKQRGGHDDRIEQYEKDATKGIEKEERRREREKKESLRKTAKEQEDRKNAAKLAAQKEADDAKAARELEARQRKEAAQKLKEDDSPAPTPARPPRPAASKLGEDDAAPPAPPKPPTHKPASGKLDDSEK